MSLILFAVLFIANKSQRMRLSWYFRYYSLYLCEWILKLFTNNKSNKPKQHLYKTKLVSFWRWNKLFLVSTVAFNDLFNTNETKNYWYLHLTKWYIGPMKRSLSCDLFICNIYLNWLTMRFYYSFLGWLLPQNCVVFGRICI